MVARTIPDRGSLIVVCFPVLGRNRRRYLPWIAIEPPQ